MSVVLLVLLYPLSYAPVVRFHVRDQTQLTVVRSGQHLAGDPPPEITIKFARDVDLPLYRPIVWLIDSTPLEKPLVKWAELWGVEAELQAERDELHPTPAVGTGFF